MTPAEMSSARFAFAPALLGDRMHHARVHKAAGGRVVGFLGNCVPVELIHAAGCFPLQLPALPGPTPRADRYMEELFDPMARSVFDRMLAGELDLVDLVVLPRAVDSLQRMYYYLCELRRTGSEAVPEAYLYDVLQTRSYSSAEYSYARTVELAARLAALSGHDPSDAQLRSSIALYNRIRSALARLIERRRAVPCGFPGAAALDVFTACQLMAPTEFLAVLDRLLAAPPQTAAGTRVVVAGSAHDEPVLHARIAMAGGQVVGDHHFRGELLLGPPVDETLPPLRALSTHYQHDVVSARTFPGSVDGFVELVRSAGAQGVVFYYYAQEEALTWDHVEQRQALQAAGVPWLCLSMQPYPASEAVDAEVQGFLARISEGRP